MDHYLPSKINVYLRRVNLEYVRAKETLLGSIVQSARTVVEPETSYDNWNGGTYTHDVVMFLPPAVMRRIPLEQQAKISERLTDDLNGCARGVENESFRTVLLELEDESDPSFQKAVPFADKAAPNPEALSIWKQGHIRLFISHRDNYKKHAKRLGRALEPYGISAFVAHDTIEPMEVWQHEIEKGLETMEIMLALVTEDFHDSTWTNQEIGYALGKGIPIIALKLGKKDPSGFIGERQALRGDVEGPEESAADIYKILAEKLGQGRRLQEGLISALIETPDWGETTIRLKRADRHIDKLTDDDLKRIVSAFPKNDQLYGAAYVRNGDRFRKFLERTTGRKFFVKHAKIKEIMPEQEEEEIPF